MTSQIRDETTGLEEKVAFLRSPRAYPHRPASVRAIGTHMSWLFLTGTLAYKLKKPVRYPFLDFTTVGRRRHYCATELRLNRRLAGEVYRRLVPLRKDAAGDLNLSGRGAITDWLVEMEQLPEEGMLDHALGAGAVPIDQVVSVAEKLGCFYAAERPRRHAGYDYIKHLYVESEVNRKLLGGAQTRLAPVVPSSLLDRVEQLLSRFAPAILERIKAGCIVEGHGDLRPEHVFLGPPPRVIDCLEFDRRMRLIDPYDEVNFLGLECELLGAPWVGPTVLDIVESFIGRRPEPGLMAFYGAFRMVLRARICMAHLLDSHPRNPDVWPRKATRYVQLAERQCLIAEG